jgi:hypothetical protein
MDNVSRYGRWLSMMSALMFIYLAVEYLRSGSFLELLIAGCFGFSTLSVLYKPGSIAWRQVVGDLGGAMLTVLLIGLLVWIYFSLRLLFA